ncbi:hypothetical protein E1264_23690 [Actinomadura sp. KC216]|uniref:hypothetical protein n=1 Tax=Actinomadura sp. KC216 TaxID=2530370 RepID=UPI00104F8300|nr:hypothetical protein [Actinomadura sp. KC216]TDB84714.1 hypothetical protein E1264_23690 [Actinomadura sp. KC216]
MIILSGVLVVVAIALLVAGIVAGNGDSAEVFNLEALTVIYISIAVSIVSALCLAIGVFLRRKELFGPPGAAPAPPRQSRQPKQGKQGKRQKAAPPPMPAAPARDAGPEATAPMGPADDEATFPTPQVDVPGDALVFVVRGRKRYHLDTCRQLAGRDTEELTYAEAKEEGFSPCTACMPDTALAARAAASGTASPDAGKAAGAAAPPRPGAERSDGGLAGLAQPAPSKPSQPASAPHSAPAPFDKTAEIPRTDEPAAREPEPPAPAGPTLTDMPVTGPFAPEQAPKHAEKSEPRGQEPDDASAADRAAESDPVPLAAPAEPRGAVAEDPLAPRAGGRRSEGRHAEGRRAEERPTEPRSEPSAAPPGDESAGEGPQVRILSGTKRYHRMDCALIEDIGDEADDLESLPRDEAKARGCTPCLVCQPDREHARD